MTTCYDLHNFEGFLYNFCGSCINRTLCPFVEISKWIEFDLWWISRSYCFFDSMRKCGLSLEPSFSWCVVYCTSSTLFPREDVLRLEFSFTWCGVVILTTPYTIYIHQRFGEKMHYKKTIELEGKREACCLIKSRIYEGL